MSTDDARPMAVSISSTKADELAVVVALLWAANLPAGDLTVNHLEHFFIARAADGKPCGVIGLEPFGHTGLMRSLTVDRSQRGKGVGHALCERLELHARELGIATLYLLTMDADGYFTAIGYTPVARSDVPETVAASTQFRGLCPDSAICLNKLL